MIAPVIGSDVASTTTEASETTFPIVSARSGLVVLPSTTRQASTMPATGAAVSEASYSNARTYHVPAAAATDSFSDEPVDSAASCPPLFVHVPSVSVPSYQTVQPASCALRPETTRRTSVAALASQLAVGTIAWPAGMLPPSSPVTRSRTVTVTSCPEAARSASALPFTRRAPSDVMPSTWNSQCPRLTFSTVKLPSVDEAHFPSASASYGSFALTLPPNVESDGPMPRSSQTAGFSVVIPSGMTVLASSVFLTPTVSVTYSSPESLPAASEMSAEHPANTTDAASSATPSFLIECLLIPSPWTDRPHTRANGADTHATCPSRA